MAQLVRQYRGQRVRVICHGNQAHVDAHIATGQGKGVDTGVINQKNLPSQLLRHLWTHFAFVYSGRVQAVPNVVDILRQQHVAGHIAACVQVAHNARTQTPLIAEA